ncbi:MAG: hypothetical protein JWP46_916, partial [Modestobacter sp.]|nr:hypothetical protein [Modestobacter sp.]
TGDQRNASVEVQQVGHVESFQTKGKYSVL